MAPLVPLPETYNFIGGSFEHYSFDARDCGFIPQPTDYKCLDFSLANFTYNHLYLDYEALKDHIIWKDSTACSGNFSQRINATYGYTIDPKVVNSITMFANSVPETRFITDVRVSFKLAATRQDGGRRAIESDDCSLGYISSTTQLNGAKYFLAERNPVCGPNAPNFNASSYPSYAFSVVKSIDVKPFRANVKFDFNPTASYFTLANLDDLAAAYAVDSSAVVYKFISPTKFSLTVSSIPGDVSANKSCVYTYRALVVSETKGRKYTLTKITEGTIPLNKGVDLNDGCLSTLIDGGVIDQYGSVGTFRFMGSVNDTCGSTRYFSRFNRYFALDKYYISTYVESAAVIVVNVTDNSFKFGNYNKPVRRAGLVEYSFTFVDLEVFPTTAVTTSTLVATSTFVSTEVSTVAVRSSTSSIVPTSAFVSAFVSAAGSVAITGTIRSRPTATSLVAVPTSYIAPAVQPYAVPTNNNLYKSGTVEKAGIIAVFAVALILS
ncbi:hypothetical protein HDU99_000183 [Rhizoclosmatium hyalinum]|nr:hypothetical protein HDU99_000183 [Rhizoclosmatium hyalinum]